ncbi:MAG: hypothetical protein WBY75_11810 [Terracidiphilus sp.]
MPGRKPDRLLRASLIVLLICRAFANAATKPCIAPDDASNFLNKDICIAAHIYDVVQVSDGTRYMDVCSPETADEQCRFTAVSLRADRDAVGELTRYRDMDVHIRGLVEPMHGRAGMVLSHARQFSGGPPKFRPNPRLVRGFAGDVERPPVSDPNLRPHGGHRAFMNSLNRETRLTK